MSKHKFCVEAQFELKNVFSSSFNFPTMATLGEDLVTVLDYLHVKYVVGLGEGAGANALARFAIAHPSRCLGLILINCTGSAASVMDHFKDKVTIWRTHFFIKIASCLNKLFYFSSWTGSWATKWLRAPRTTSCSTNLAT